MQQQSLGGAKYYVCFKDDFTKYRRVFFMQSKNEVSKCLETFLNEAKKTGHMIKEVLSDGGGEDHSDRVTSSSSPQWRRVRSSMPQDAPKSTYESYSRSERNPITHHRGWRCQQSSTANLAIIL
ncbi:retrovirus-related Pol polyprotein from transposon TNT 1-94 [Trichonephila clavata]|uniref:Retrovirus-related Pol polyprotein from transposon TNT 1-94 n=1 Tax=Trichonephila clavata TaxID=2740835 RepID=A0A8X6G5Z4_TRICU|nr:retrovirus-related Pol polyprotein from transposon TNT 1-94 [Trichonephila clavata]